MEGITIPPEVYTNPVVLWVIVAGVALGLLIKFGKSYASQLAPLFTWWSQRDVRRLQRQGELEKAAEALNDQRNRLLSVQLSGVSAQLEGVLRQAREDAERHHREIESVRNQLSATQAQLADTQVQLTKALAEIASLRSELAAYQASSPQTKS
ncbi:hypothetical protein QNA24_30210 [Rhodococcus qingshengii]|uniref:hypothetical protein n=1 Tax=Rhodococcus TaxID=1827 RepID=UPI001E321EEE|nr:MULTISPECIES: hypothetical protein [Rhodococcus]MCD2099524.1 hypothetical protein [Rhodococcus rhodochrous]MCD2123892.1 hypothetical protein [Rhodococcus rhodochrous]MCQ4136681.1 hypothetical protein [Rhodococcus rhodochrous]MDJ0490658.1 hypothetical protein [Rhodococcus qingshengii]